VKIAANIWGKFVGNGSSAGEFSRRAAFWWICAIGDVRHPQPGDLKPSMPELLEFMPGPLGARSVLGHMEPTREPSPIGLISEACRVSLSRSRYVRLLKRMLQRYRPENDGIWPALARHLVGLSSLNDRAALESFSKSPELKEPPLRWGLQFVVRGDIMFDDGTSMTLDELADDLQLPHLPHLEEVMECADPASSTIPL
jgi:hypothetical protein